MEHSLEVKTDTNEYTLQGRPCELSAFSFVPTSRNDPGERTYYNSQHKKNKQTTKGQDRYPHDTYDRLFKKPTDYNNKLHRDDREHAKLRGLTVNDEEKEKDVPTLSSSEYGHHLHMFADPSDRKHVRIAHVKKDFYRNNGIYTHS